MGACFILERRWLRVSAYNMDAADRTPIDRLRRPTLLSAAHKEKN
jgi:hypothetical protein